MQFERLLYVSRHRRDEVLSDLSAQDSGRWVAVDLVTGEYELDDNPGDAERKLAARVPGAMAWMFEVRADYDN